VADLGLE
jgi:hypothetical protein